MFRTDRQAEAFVAIVRPPAGAAILDFGSGKGRTAAKVGDLRGDLDLYVFEVSSSYEPSWREWLPFGRYASYALPADWAGRFDVVMANFVLEHVLDPGATLRTISSLLKKDGTVFLLVPDPVANSGDILVADHVSHFSPSSLQRALSEAGLGGMETHPDAFEGAIAATARKGAPTSPLRTDAKQGAEQLRAKARFWVEAQASLELATEARKNCRCAIYGAGVYGTFIASRIRRQVDIACFVDRNPHVRSRPHLGLPVVDPQHLPGDIRTIFAGLNPSSARAILSDVPEWRDRGLDIVYLA